MSVKFTPGPHPTSCYHSRSATPTPGSGAAPAPASASASASASGSHPPTPLPPGTPASYHLDPPRRPHEHPILSCDPHFLDDPERQPLLDTPEGEMEEREGEERGAPVLHFLIGMGCLLVLGVVLGYGGYRLGHGEGGDRWPGGPQF